MKRVFLAGAALCTLAPPALAGGMPQLDFASPLLKAQVVWGAIIFLVFYLAVSRWGLPKVGAILEHRETAIAQDLEQARFAKQNADRAVSELNEARRVAYLESQNALAAATQKAKDAAAARAAEVNARLDRQLDEAEAQIAAARGGAMAALRGVATDTAEAIVERLTGRASAASVSGAVAEALQRRGLSA